MASKTQDPNYSDNKRNNITEINISFNTHFSAEVFFKRCTYFCVFYMIIEFYSYLHDRI